MNREILFRGKHIHATDSNEHLNGTWVHALDWLVRSVSSMT